VKKEDPTRNERAKRLYHKRKQEGMVKLAYWISAKARSRLEAMAAKSGKEPADLLEELIQRA